MTFRPISQSDYRRGIELRALDAQINTLIALIAGMNARLRQTGDCSHAEAHTMNGYRVELIERRHRRAQITGPVVRYGSLWQARQAVLGEKHVVVGDHTPEPRAVPRYIHGPHRMTYAALTRRGNPS